MGAMAMQPAQAQPVTLHIDAAAAALRDGIALPAAAPAWSTAPDAIQAACATPGAAIRLILVARGVPRLGSEACRRGGAELLVLTLGHQALVMVTPSGAAATSIDPAALFRAFAANAPAGTPAGAPAALLAPAAGSRDDALFSALILESGCLAALPAAALPHDAAARATFCGALRNGVPRRAAASLSEGVAQLRSWAAGAPPGAVAAIGMAEWRELAGAVLPLPVEGMLPTAANLHAGTYPAARPVQLLVVLPRAAGMRARDAALDIGFALLSEAVTGPMGSLAAQGVTAVAPAERVDARQRLTDMLGAP